jgi:Trp operon repressor
MTPQQFGQLAAQLLASAQIPGEALDQAMAFRAIASDLATGKATITPVAPAAKDEANADQN